MRAVLLSLLFALPLSAECITWTPRAIEFFHRSTGVAYARGTKEGGFVITAMVFGTIPPDEALRYRARFCCPPPMEKAIYLITRFCSGEGCTLHFVPEKEASRLFAYRRRAHAETHETVLARDV